MRTSLWVLVVALAGCGGQQAVGDGGWVATSAALQAHGIYSVRTSGDAADASAKVVALRDQAQASVGRLSLSQSAQGQSVVLEFRGDRWGQSFDAGAQGNMVMTLNGSEGTFRFDGSAWQGDANAQSVMSRSASLIELAKLIGAEAHLTLSSPTPASAPSTDPATAPSTDPATAPQPPATPTTPGATLSCTEAVVYAQGQATFFEPPGEACKRAQLALTLECKAATISLAIPAGLGCCNAPTQPPCFNCIDVGFFTQCSTYGYLQQVD